MTSRKRPSLRDNLTGGADAELQLADRQLAQVAALEELRKGKPEEAGPADTLVVVPDKVLVAPAPANSVVETKAPLENRVLEINLPAEPTVEVAATGSSPRADKTDFTASIPARTFIDISSASTDKGPVPAEKARPEKPPAHKEGAERPIIGSTTGDQPATGLWQENGASTSRSANSTAAYLPTRQPVLPDRSVQQGERRMAFIIGASMASVMGLAGVWFGLALSDAKGTASSRAEALESRIKVLETQLAGERAANVGRNAILETAVAELRMPLERAAGGASVMGILTAQQLRHALNGPGPFKDQLALFRTSSFGSPDLNAAIDQIAPRAMEGIASKVDLANLFASIVPAVLTAEIEAGNHRDIGIGQTMWNWMTSLPGVITGGGPAANVPADMLAQPPYIPDEDRPAALLARAGLMLEAGDLAGAIERLSRLPEPTANIATPWIEEARMRIAADLVVRLLGGRIDELLVVVNR